MTDLRSCTTNGFFDYGVLPSHGLFNNRNTNYDRFVYYTNNGDGATSDFFSVTDADDGSDVQFTVTVASAGPSVTTPGLPGGTVGLAYSQALTATGGTAPYS